MAELVGGPVIQDPAAIELRDTSRPRRSLIGLLFPVSPGRAVALCQVPDRTAAIGDALGAFLLDDVMVPLPGGELISLYRAEEYPRLPDNPRLATVLARLGVTDRRVQASLRGNVLVFGGVDVGTVIDLDVPVRVVTACLRCGIPVVTDPAR